MIRNLKAFALALVAVVAMSALVASAAQAVPTLTATEHGTVVGSQVGSHEFTVGSRAMICNNVTFSGPSATSQTTLTITPTYTGCRTTPVLGVELFITVTMNGCDYLYHMGALDGTTYTASTDIICPAGKVIETHVYNNAAHTSEACTSTVSPATGLNKSEITNVSAGGGKPNDLLIHHTISGIPITIHGSALICGSGTTGTWTGTTTLQAKNTAGALVGLTASG